MPSGNNARYFKRLKLDEIVFNNIEKYKFEYDSNILPNYFYPGMTLNNYYQQDEWGYYNGKPNNTLLVYIPPTLTQSKTSADRSSDATYMKACVLNTIIYPTGGKTTFTFTGNKTFNNQTVGGLRIENISSFNLQNSLQKSIDYLYSPGIKCCTSNLWKYFQAVCVSGGSGSITFPTATFYSSSNLYPNTHANGSSVVYQYVDEIVNSELKTSYEYEIFDNKYFYDNSKGYPLSGKEKFWDNYSNSKTTLRFPYEYYYIDNTNIGKLKRKTIYKKNTNTFDVLREEIYTWKTYNEKDENIGLFIQTECMPSSSYSYDQYLTREDVFLDGLYTYNFFNYKIKIGTRVLDKLETIDHTSNGNISKTQQYTYDGLTRTINTHPFATKELQVLNDKSIIYEFMRPLDYFPNTTLNDQSNSTIAELSKKNNISEIIEEGHYSQINNIDIYTGGKINTFKFTNNMVLPYISYESFEYQNNYNKSRVENNQFIFDNSLFTANLNNITRNNMGDIIMVTDKSNIGTTYLYGYNNQYIIAEIRNATYLEVYNALSGINPEQLANSFVPDMAKVEALRQSSNLSNAQITTYTYKPLVGITSKTDPRGVITYYKYDSFNRLQRIIDTNSQIIQKFDYNYKQ